MRRELNGRMVSLNGGMRRMLTADKYKELEQLDEYERTLGDYGKGIRYDLQGLQRRNPIQVGSYLGVIYWDGKGTQAGKSIGLRRNDDYYWLFVNQGLLVRNKIEGGDYTVIGDKPGYYVIDMKCTVIQPGAYDEGAIYPHIAALELHKAGGGDEFSRFYWDGTSEGSSTSCVYNSYIPNAYQYIKGINATTIQYGIGDGTKQANVDKPGWYSINELSKGEYTTIPVNLVDRAGAKPVLWVPGLPSTATQPLVDESRAVEL